MSDLIYPYDVMESKNRGDRLRRLRNLANLARKELCSEANININTYIGYEVGRYGGLTKKGADVIIRYLSTKGVYSSFEWLMDGSGSTPSVETQLKYDACREDKVRDEKQIITEEIFLFKKHYAHTFDYQIIDDGMLPIYSIGDYVAGVYQTEQAIKTLIGLNCIMKLINGDIIVRNLRPGKEANKYTLYCINIETTVGEPIIYNIKLEFAAKIIWHRRCHINKYVTN